MTFNLFFRGAILFLILAVPSLQACAQSQDEPYFYTPTASPMNNRFVPDRCAACLYAQLGVRACTKTEVMAKDSFITRMVFHPNGYIDSAYFPGGKVFDYTKVGGRETRMMTTDCNSDSLLTMRGVPGSKTEAPAPTRRGKVTRWFDANGYLCKRTTMAGGLLKYNDSWAGNWNVMQEIKIDSAGRLLELTVYLSHWWFFSGPSRKYVYRYDERGLLTEETETHYSGRHVHSVVRRKYAYELKA